MYKYLFISIFLSTFLLGIQANFSVYMPQCAINKFPTRYINYTLANFGHIPYGTSQVGELIIPQEQQLCNEDSFTIASRDDIKKFMLIKRGSCKFTKKIINAQKLKMDFVIVYDNQQTKQPNVIMANDGFGHLVDIPAIFISYFDGIALVDAFKECKEVILNMKFDVSTSQVANLTFWLDSNNRQTYITIRDFFQTFYIPIQSKINFNVNFKINLKCTRSKCEKKDCIVDTTDYCLHTQKQVNGVPLPGNFIIEENLRSYFILEALKNMKVSESIWWRYMIEFDNLLCLEKIDVQGCSREALLKVFPAIKFDDIKKSVEDTKNKAKNQTDNVMKKFSTSAYDHDIMFYPEATINGRNYYGLFKAADIFNMVCQSLISPPKQCHSFTKSGTFTTTQDSTKELWKTIALIVGMMLIFFLVAIFVYTRIINRQMNKKMSSEANRMVEHYMAMTEEKSKSNVGL